MKITLKNFRCHRDAHFEIPDEGLVMLSGESGMGKTTILNAVAYAMYGNLRKPYSHGTTTCQVTLEIKGMTITRSNRPNRVIVEYQEAEYEDDAAQGLIDKVFGMNFQEFMASSYVVQSLHNSVVSMTPTEQVKFVEKLAFSDDIHVEYRTKFKEAVKAARETLTRAEGKLAVIEKQISSAEADLPEDPSDIDGVDPDEVKRSRSETLSQIKTIKGRLKALEEELSQLQDVEKQNAELIEQKRKLEVEISQFTQLRTNLGEILEPEEIEGLETKLEELKTLLSQTKSYQSHKAVLAKIEKYQTDNATAVKERIAELEDSLPSQKDLSALESSVEGLEELRQKHSAEASEIADAKKARDTATTTIKEIFTDAKKLFTDKQLSRIKKGKALLNFLERKLKVLKGEMEAAKRAVKDLEAGISRQDILGKVYTCPCCSAKLAFKDEELCEAPDAPEAEDEEASDAQVRLTSERMNLTSSSARVEKVKEWVILLQASLAELEKTIPKPTVKYNHREAVDMEKRLAEHRRTQKDIEALKTTGSTETSAVKDLKAEAKILAKGYPKKFTPTLDAEAIEEQISQVTSDLDEAWRNKSEHSSLSREISTREGKLRYINKRLPGNKKLLPSRKTRDISTVQGEISSLQSSVIELTGKLEELAVLAEHIATYEVYKRDLKSLEKLKTQRDSYESERSAAEKELEGALGLEAAGKEAEILAMEKTIESINEHAKGYLEELFEDTIVVRLEGTKTTSRGATKTQMNTIVEYRGDEYSSIDELSGGETQRVELAFLLAVNDMIGSQMILLDECLNNLDAGINMEVLSHLRDLSDGKLILVVSHEAVQGVFDDIVTL